MDLVPDSLFPSLQLLSDGNAKADEDDASLLHALHHEAVKIAVIKAAILHGTTTHAPEPAVAEYRGRLVTFHKDLPPWMTLRQLLVDWESGTPKELRTAVLYVHLFYTSTMMALSRRLIAVYVPREPVGALRIPPESSQAIAEGFMVAQMAVRVLDLMLPEGSVIDACWLCMYRVPPPR